MAKQTDTIKKDGQIFYALIQLTFGQDPVFALGEREIMAKCMLIAEMYDKKTEKITKNCLLWIDTETLVQISNHKSISLKAPDAWLDPMTPRYWFTNTNRD